MGQFHFDAASYLELMHAELPRYEDLQEQTALATTGINVETILELGVGTGETARRVLALHPRARLVGIDASADMLAAAGAVLPEADLRVARLEDALPRGPFDLVVSALAVHHLDSHAKRGLFGRIAAELRPGGRFVLAEVIIPEDPTLAVTPLSPDFDLPDRLDDQLAWLADAGFEAAPVWLAGDLAVIIADG